MGPIESTQLKKARYSAQTRTRSDLGLVKNVRGLELPHYPAVVLTYGLTHLEPKLTSEREAELVRSQAREAEHAESIQALERSLEA